MDVVTLEQAGVRLLDGAVGVLPTDTLYGLVARAADPAAVARLYRLKRRERKPGTVIAASPDQLVALGLAEADIRAAAHFWPNPLSIVLTPRDDTLPHLHQGWGDFAVRIPADARLRELLQTTGPLVTSSANFAGEPAATTITAAQAYFSDAVDFYVDGGDLAGRLPSTVARITPDGLQILRQGAFSL